MTEPASTYALAPLGVALLRLYLNRELKRSIGTNAGFMQTKMALGSPSLKKMLEKNRIPKMESAKKLVSEFGIGWTDEFYDEVFKLKESEKAELNELLQRLTLVFALIAAFGMNSFIYGPATLFQKCWKAQSLQETLCIMILTLGQTSELIKLVNFFDALLPEKTPNKDRRGALNF